MIIYLLLAFLFGFGAGIAAALLLGCCRCAALKTPDIHTVAARDARVFSRKHNCNCETCGYFIPFGQIMVSTGTGYNCKPCDERLHSRLHITHGGAR